MAKNVSKKESASDSVPENTSKFILDEKEMSKNTTVPNPVVLNGVQAIGLTRLNPINIPKYLLMHPALPRGIEIKANRMVKLLDADLSRNIVVNPSQSNNAKEAAKYCRKILRDSGGPLWVKKMTMGAFRFGTSFAVLQTNVGENEVLRFEHEHEIYFGPATYPKVMKGKGVDWGRIPMDDRAALMGKMKINPLTKTIAQYTQLTRKYPERTDDNFNNNYSTYLDTKANPRLMTTNPGDLVPIGDEFPEKEVIQLAFDTLGDEPLGISLVQFLHLTIKYLLNMEQAGAQTQVNFGFNKWKANTPFKDQKKMKAFAHYLANLQKDSIIVLPEGIELDNIEPGQTDFDKVHPIYLQLIAMRLGIPMPLLTQSGTATNKSTVAEQRKDMNDDFIADEMTIEMSVSQGFVKACKIKWPDLTNVEMEDLVPSFKFNQPPEELEAEADNNLKFTLSMRNLASAAKQWSESGGDQDILKGIGFKMKELLTKSMEFPEAMTGQDPELEKGPDSDPVEEDPEEDPIEE